ncbi:hypothetical protein O6H91_23G021300 [Diphasiastrum complanatum]|uniref:Uncharacterized protein n=1 Tax=Diphasiastrum complanatum TaxID=34168 RepID=A0ACC2A8T5_DIPCM|nr:hypothetical protein O6H91_23G021300 [Diphasiastrum complanatum]
MSKYHGKRRSSFDSEGTSFGASPPQSPRHPVYFVQSPSRESHDGDKPSIQSTPALSPTASPLHPSFIQLPPARDHENGQRVVSHPKPGSRRILPQPSYGGVALPQVSHKKGYQKWTPNSILEEEEQQAGYRKRKELSRCCMFWLSVLFCILIFLTGVLIFWLVYQPHSPQVEVKDITFFEFEVVSGTDEGVPTDVLSTNCTLTLSIMNPSKYFGVHVRPSQISLLYQDLLIGTGQVPTFYQDKNSKSMFVVVVTASKLPLYGAGPSLQSITDAGGGVTLQIGGVIESRAYVFWKFIKPRFTDYFSCNIIVSSSGVNFLKLLQKTCSYH